LYRFSAALEEAQKSWRTEGNVELNCVKENFSKMHEVYNDMDQKMADILEDNRSYKNKVSRIYSKREDLIRESNELQVDLHAAKEKIKFLEDDRAHQRALNS
jgi:peptidoglycan hydrolase CwlO-like protein